MRFHSLPALCLFVVTMVSHVSLRADDDGLRKRLEDANGVRTDVWVYNDINKAMQQARTENKPLFVTFRCVPCAAFDADVANGNDRVRALAKEKFISVRQVEMKGVDLSLFQFDHDLNWAAMFVNADGVVYARYGTQSAEGPDAYNSIDGLLNTMQRVLELHAAYPNNIEELRGKRGKPRKTSSALKMPGLQNPAKLAAETTRRHCIHCHMIHDAEHAHAQRSKTFTHEMLLRFPLPNNVGLELDRTSGTRIIKVFRGSAAAGTELKAGDEIIRMNGQRIASIADLQWVLHGLPNTNTELNLESDRSGLQTLKLKAGWKKYDISWRGSIWSVSPRLRVWAPSLSFNQRRERGLSASTAAFQVKWINRGSAGGRSAFESGLRQATSSLALMEVLFATSRHRNSTCTSS